MNGDPKSDSVLTYIGIDPGRTKCGFAVVRGDGARNVVDVVLTVDLADRIEAAMRSASVSGFCVGHATGSDAIVELCRSRWPDVPRHVVDETNTTLEARRLYYDDHPPRGLWRFVPRGLLVPDEALDGYAAVLIVERFLRGSS